MNRIPERHPNVLQPLCAPLPWPVPIKGWLANLGGWLDRLVNLNLCSALDVLTPMGP